jgi:CheY-like chemotaxis protein
VARSLNILLVEDSPDDALLVSTAVERTLLGIRVLLVHNGQEAMRYLDGQSPYCDRARHPFPDLVLLDLKMPLVNGFEVLRWIRSQPGLRRLPVIVLTGSLLPEDKQKAYDEGANSYLVKPLDFSGMMQTIKSMGEFWLAGPRFPDAGQVS